MYIAASARRYLRTVSAGHKLQSRELWPNVAVSKWLQEGAWTLYVLEFFHKQILDQNFLLGLNLEQLEKQANELRWPLIAVYASNRFESDGVVDKRLRFPQVNR